MKNDRRARRPEMNMIPMPNMLLEAALCAFERGGGREEKLMENPGRFGLTEADIRVIIGDFLAYRDAVMPRVLALLDAHADLLPYLDMQVNSAQLDHWTTIATALAFACPGENWGAFTGGALDMLIDRTFIMALSNALGDDIPMVSEMEDPVGYLYAAEGLTDAQKLLLIRFYTDSRRVVPRLYALLREIADVLEVHYDRIRPAIERLLTKLSGEDDGVDAIFNHAGVSLGFEAVIYDVYVSVFGYNGIMIYSFESARVYVYVGLYVLTLRSLADARDMESVTDLKAIADATRWRILRMLAREALYVSELAERLQLTPATVLHHLDTLTGCGLISLRTEEISDKKRRVRYKTNAQALGRIADKIRKAAEEVDHGQEA